MVGMASAHPSGLERAVYLQAQWPEGGASAKGSQGEAGRALPSKKSWHDVVGRLHGSSASFS